MFSAGFHMQGKYFELNLVICKKNSVDGQTVCPLQWVFWDVRQCSPKEMAAHKGTTFFSFCVCGLFAPCVTDQSHNSKVQITC